jgi:hypothetical protein
LFPCFFCMSSLPLSFVLQLFILLIPPLHWFYGGQRMCLRCIPVPAFIMCFLSENQNQQIPLLKVVPFLSSGSSLCF